MRAGRKGELTARCQGSVKEVSRKCQGSVKEVSSIGELALLEERCEAALLTHGEAGLPTVVRVLGASAVLLSEPARIGADVTPFSRDVEVAHLHTHTHTYTMKWTFYVSSGDHSAATLSSPTQMSGRGGSIAPRKCLGSV